MRAGVRRVGVILAVLWGVASMAFIAVRLTPGDPVAVLTGGENVVDAGERAVLIQQYGLDRPLVVQYARYLAHALSGDLGDSYQYRQTVAAVIAETAMVSTRFAKRQQMWWTRRDTPLLLQTRTPALDGTLRPLFEWWHPGLANDNPNKTSQSATA